MRACLIASVYVHEDVPYSQCVHEDVPYSQCVHEGVPYSQCVHEDVPFSRCATRNVFTRRHFPSTETDTTRALTLSCLRASSAVISEIGSFLEVYRKCAMDEAMTESVSSV